MWLGLAAEVEGKGRTADDLAYLRDAWDFRNLLLVERPNGDFGHTLMRQFLFDAYHLELLKALHGVVRPARRRDRGQGRQGGRLPSRAVLGPRDPARRWHATRATAGCRRRSTRFGPTLGEMFVSDEKDATVAAARHRTRPGEPAGAAGSRRSRDVLTEATLTSPRAPSPTRAASAASIPSISATSSPTCSSCSAPIPARPGEGGDGDRSRNPAPREVWDWLSHVPDPEIPVISLTDLGIIRDVAWDDDTLVVTVTPTYTGCPATTVINLDIEKALRAKGVGKLELKRQISPRLDHRLDQRRGPREAQGLWHRPADRRHRRRWPA